MTQLLSVNEAALRLGVSVAAFRKWVHQHQLTPVKLGRLTCPSLGISSRSATLPFPLTPQGENRRHWDSFCLIVGGWDEAVWLAVLADRSEVGGRAGDFR